MREKLIKDSFLAFQRKKQRAVRIVFCRKCFLIFRSHKFEIRAATPEMEGRDVYNVAVRGKRGNIVQVYPAVEYDFVPNRLEVEVDDIIHFQ